MSHDCYTWFMWKTSKQIFGHLKKNRKKNELNVKSATMVKVEKNVSEKRVRGRAKSMCLQP